MARAVLAEWDVDDFEQLLARAGGHRPGPSAPRDFGMLAIDMTKVDLICMFNVTNQSGSQPAC